MSSARNLIREMQSKLTKADQSVSALYEERDKLLKENKELRQSYQKAFDVFGRLQDIILGKHSSTETFDDLLAPVQVLVEFRAQILELIGFHPHTKGNREICNKITELKEAKKGARTYTPPAGFSLVETEGYIKTCQEIEQLKSLKESVCSALGVSKENDPHHLSVRLKSDIGRLTKDSEELSKVRQILNANQNN